MSTINFSDITNSTAYNNGTGSFDVLMKTLTLHVEEQYNKGRIKGPDYATVYLGLMQSALQSSQQFALTKALTEAQIDSALKDLALKDAQLITESMNQELLNLQQVKGQYELDILLPDQHSQNVLQIGKSQYELDVILADQHDHNIANIAEVTDSTMRANTQLEDSLLTSDKQRLDIDKGMDLKVAQIQEEQYKLTVLLPDQHNTNNAQLESVIKDIEIKERSAVVQESELSDKLLTSIKQRALLDEEFAKATYEINTLLPDQHNNNLKQIDTIIKDIEIKERSTVVQESQLEDQLLSSSKDRALKDKQIEEEQYKLDVLLPDQHQQSIAQLTEIEKSTLRADIQLEDQLLSTDKERSIKDTQIVGMLKDNEVKDVQIDLTKFELNSLQPAQLDKIKVDIDVTERGIVEQEATGEKQRLMIVKQTANLENEDLLRLVQIGKTKIEADIQAALGAKDVDLKEEQLSMAIFDRTQIKAKELEGLSTDVNIKGEQLLITSFDREFIKAKELEQLTAQVLVTVKQEDQLDEQILISKQEVKKITYEVSVLLPDQHLQNSKQLLEIEAATLRANTQLNDQLLTTEKDRMLKDLQLDTEALQQQMLEKQRLNLENEDLLRLVQIGKTKIEADIQAAIGAKDVDLKEEQLKMAIFDRTQVKTKELEGLGKDVDIKGEQLLITTFDRTYMKGKELEQITAQVEMVNKQGDQLDEQILIAKQEVQKATYEVVTLLPDQHQQNAAQLTEIEKATARADRQLADQLLTTAIDRTLKDSQVVSETLQQEILNKQIVEEQYKLDVLLIDQHKQSEAQLFEISDSTVRANEQLVDQLLTMAIDRSIKTYEANVLQIDQHKQAEKQLILTDKDIEIKDRSMILQEEEHTKKLILLDTEEASKQYELGYILPKQVDKLAKEIEISERGAIENELTGDKQRESIDTEIAMREQEIIKLDSDIKLSKQKVVGRFQV